MGALMVCGVNTKRWDGLLRWLPGLIMACGIALRLRQYLHVRSLWLDEAFLANSMVHESFWDLLSGPMLYGHVLPLGFVAFSKGMASAFGNHELALRFLPLGMGCAVLPLAYLAAKVWISKRAALVTLALFSFSEILIYYSGEFKSYSCDAFFATALIAAAGYAFTAPHALRRVGVVGLVGLIAPWFSQPSLFVLFAVGCLGLMRPLPPRNRIGWFIVLVLWGVNVASIFALQYGGINPAASLPARVWVDYFYALDGAFPPTRYPHVLFWLKDSFFRMFTYPASLGMGAALGAVLLIAGGSLLCLQRKIAAFLFMAPFAVCLLASLFHYYAFNTLHMIGSRGIVFLVPSIYMMIAAGLDGLHFQATSPNRRNIWVKALLMAWLFAYPLHQSLHFLRSPVVMEDLKTVVADMQKDLQKSDTIYAYYWTEPAFRYYAPRSGFNPNQFRLIAPTSTQPFLKDVSYARIQSGMQPVPPNSTRFIWGSSELFGECEEELRTLAGRGRAWIVFSHIDSTQKSAFLDFLNRSGTQLKRIEYSGASAFLYQMSLLQNPNPNSQDGARPSNESR